MPHPSNLTGTYKLILFSDQRHISLRLTLVQLHCLVFVVFFCLKWHRLPPFHSFSVLFSSHPFILTARAVSILAPSCGPSVGHGGRRRSHCRRLLHLEVVTLAPALLLKLLQGLAESRPPVPHVLVFGHAANQHQRLQHVHDVVDSPALNTCPTSGTKEFAISYL